MGPLERVLGLLRKPEEVFKELKERPDFTLPILFILLTVLSSLYTTEYSQEIMRLYFPQMPSIETTSPGLLGVITGTIVTLFLWVLKTLLYYGMAILLGGDGPFKGILSIIGYTHLATLLQNLLATTTLLLWGTPITIGPGQLLPISQQLFTLKGMIYSSVNIFEIFLIVLTMIGLAVAMDLTHKKSLFITLFFWVLGKGLTIGFTFLSLRFIGQLL